jgi:hypothetical protein
MAENEVLRLYKGPEDRGETEDDSTNPKDALGRLKPPLYLIPQSANILEAVVFELGARKYGGAYNWRVKPVRASVYVSAAMRHLAQWLDGQNDDPESGVSHLAHARACLGILLDAAATGHLVDDRPQPGAASMLIEQYTQQEPSVRV